MALLPETHEHPLAHHRDLQAFAELVAQSHAARFDNLWWGFVDTYTTPNPFRVVDFGTGPALLVQDLCERFPGAEVVGVDAQPAMLARAREVLEPFENARLIEHDLSAPPIPGLEEAESDVVILSMVLHEMRVPTCLLDEAYRIVAPGGVLLIYDWMRHPLAAYVDGALPDDVDAFAHFSEHCRFTPDDYAWLVEQSGFAVHEVLTRREGRRVMIAARRREN